VSNKESSLSALETENKSITDSLNQRNEELQQAQEALVEQETVLNDKQEMIESLEEVSKQLKSALHEKSQQITSIEDELVESKKNLAANETLAET